MLYRLSHPRVPQVRLRARRVLQLVPHYPVSGTYSESSLTEIKSRQDRSRVVSLYEKKRRSFNGGITLR